MSGQKVVIPLKPIDFEATARAVEKYAQQNNVPSLSFPAEKPSSPDQSTPALPTPSPAGASRLMKRLPMEVPEYVMDSLKDKARETKGASVRFVVLSALKAYGIKVLDEELVKDKRRPL